MKSEDPFHEIGELLRSHKPDPRPSPGLEGRILRSLPPRQPSPAAGRFWPWFLLPPAAAAGIVLLWPEPVAVPVITRQEPPPVPVVEPRAAAIFQANPLEQEKLALQRDARRASRFLIDCLPSLDTALE